MSEKIVKKEEEKIVEKDHYAGGLKNEAGMDLQIPYVNVIAKTGKMSDMFPKNVGEYLYDGTTLAGASINAYLVGFKPYYIEKTGEDSEEMPRKFDTIDEANKAGYYDDFQSEHRVVPAAFLEMFIEAKQDSDLASWGSFVVGDNSYIAARMEVKARGFKNVGGKIDTMRVMGALRDGLHLKKLTLGSELAEYNSMSWYVPNLKVGGDTPGEVKKEIETLFPNLKK